MNIMKPRIVWFPEIIVSVTEDNLENNIPWENKHLEEVRSFMEKDGLLFPGVVRKKEIHCGHYRFKIAKEMGYDGIQMYETDTFENVLKLTNFTQLCYKHYKEYKEGGYI